MRDRDEHSITAAVLEKVAATPEPRLRQISQALVRHLHGFVREVEPSQDEWAAAIDFLTRTGQMCSPTRQEFILLSDTLGVSMLVDAINHRAIDGVTASTVLGPFHVADTPAIENGSIISPAADGTPLLIEGGVSDRAGLAIADATVDIWHADGAGLYDVQKGPHEHSGRGRVRANRNGHFHVFGVVPAAYPIPADGPVGAMLAAQGRHPYRPAHVHFMVRAPGYEPLVTHLFLADSDYLDGDVVFGVKDTLIEKRLVAPAGPTPFGAMLSQPMQVLRRQFTLADRRIGGSR